MTQQKQDVAINKKKVNSSSMQNHKRERVSPVKTSCSNRGATTYGSKTPARHNNSQDICTQLHNQDETEPPSEIPPSAHIVNFISPGCLDTILPVSDDFF